MSKDAMLDAGFQDVRGHDKLVLFALAWHKHHRTGQCNPSQAKLAVWCGIARSTVKESLQALEEAGLLVWERGNTGRSNRYTLVLTRPEGGLDLAAGRPPHGRRAATNRPKGSVPKESILVSADGSLWCRGCEEQLRPEDGAWEQHLVGCFGDAG